MITKIAFVGHPTRDLEAAKHFYGDLLGLTLQREYHGGWAEYAAADQKTIALDTYSPKFSDAPRPYLALESDDIVAEVARLEAAGATIKKGVWENRDGEGALVCKMALVADPDGNEIMLHEIAPHRR